MKKEKEVVEKEVVDKEVVEKEVVGKEGSKNDLKGFKPEGGDNEVKDDTPKEEVKPNLVPGQVFGTSRLKMHDRPGGGKTVIKKLLIKGDGVVISLKDSTENYYKVSHGDAPHKVEGFSLKKYIQV